MRNFKSYLNAPRALLYFRKRERKQMWLGLDDSHSSELWAGDLAGEATVTAEHQRVHCRSSDNVLTFPTRKKFSTAETQSRHFSRWRENLRVRQRPATILSNDF